MADVSKKGGKKGRKIGREAHHPSHVLYKKNNVRAKNKARRILQSNGKEALLSYCAKHDLAVTSLTTVGKHMVLVLKNIIKV